MSRGWVLPLHSTALCQPRPQGFSLKKWVELFPPHPFFKGKALGTRLALCYFKVLFGSQYRVLASLGAVPQINVTPNY